jgi:hypothetical protein
MRRLAIASLVMLSAVGVSAAPAQAAPTAPKVCSGAGELFVNSNPSGGTDWSLRGSGFCGTITLPAVALKTVQLVGFGHSDTLGLCDSTLLVMNLGILVIARFTDVVTHVPTTQTEIWYSPISVFPLVTPFIAAPLSGGIGGAGVLFSHILLKCGNGGNSPSLQFDWLQTF